MDGLSSLLQSFTDVLRPAIEFLVWVFPVKMYRLHDGQRGVIKTFGKVREWRKAEVEAGIVFCGPFEELISIQAIGGYIDCAEQTIYTKDKKVVMVNAAIIYSIFSVQKAVLESEAIEFTIQGHVMDALRTCAESLNYNELIDSDNLTKKLVSKINSRLKISGAKIEQIMITDLRPHPITMICDTIMEVSQSGIRIVQDRD